VFLNVAEAGVGGKVVAYMNAHPGIARTRVGYRLGTMAAALIHRRQILEVAMDGNPAISTDPTLSLIIAGGRYFGTGMKCAPMARPDDGLFEVITIGNFGPAELLCKIHRFFSGTYLDDRKITHRTARSIEVHSAAPVPLELDGELVGSLPASFRILPSALAIRC
jgi:diacylglycerol kinase (ATP)